MVGIDVVDLHDSGFRPRTKDELRFILHPEDQLAELIDHPSLYWILWAAKESVFKARREDVRFDPKTICVRFTFCSSKSAEFTADFLLGKVSITDNWVLAVCQEWCFDTTFRVFETAKGQVNEEVRKLVITDSSEKFKNSTSIGREEKMPVILSEAFPGRIPVSFSHHGRYLAFAYPDSEAYPGSHQDSQQWDDSKYC